MKIFKILLIIPLLLVISCAGSDKANNRYPVQLGVEIFLDGNLSQVREKRVGLMTNPTGVDRKLRSTIDLLFEHKDINLVALFSPEHGIRGAEKAGAKITSSKDELTGLPVRSLYGKTRKPTKEMFSNIDIIIIDIQDIGSRAYTYISTLYYCLQTAAENGKTVIVLDRPNPTGGEVIDGPVLESNFRSFIGIAEIPVVHGMTIGEIAKYFNKEEKINAKLFVVPMKGWKRSMKFSETKLPWVSPSPHIPTAATALLYPVTGLIGEAGNICEGVGTPMPFHILGAPWMDGSKYKHALPKMHGVLFRPVTVKPYYFKYKDTEVHGVQIHVTDHQNYKPVEAALHLLSTAHKLWPEKFDWMTTGKKWKLKGMDRAWGTDAIRKQIIKSVPPEQIIAKWQPKIDEFKVKRQNYLIY